MIRLAIRCKAENAELALAQLIELAPTGIEEIRDGDIVEYAVYGPPGEVPTLPDLQVAVGDDLVEVRTTEVADDWQERWKDFHQLDADHAGLWRHRADDLLATELGRR